MMINDEEGERMMGWMTRMRTDLGGLEGRKRSRAPGATRSKPNRRSRLPVIAAKSFFHMGGVQPPLIAEPTYGYG
jgi:hypothetical protein